MRGQQRQCYRPAGMILLMFFFLKNVHMCTLQKSNIDTVTRIAIFKGSYLIQTIILGIHVSFRGCNPIIPVDIQLTHFTNR